VKKSVGELGVVDLYEHYQQWCRENHLRSFPSKPFNRLGAAAQYPDVWRCLVDLTL
jgi:hypothetical protein